MKSMTSDKQALFDYAVETKPQHADQLFVLIRFEKITTREEIDGYNG